MPNPWDVGTARWLQQAGFPALATTSAGAAFAMGLPDDDRAVSCEATLGAAGVRRVSVGSGLARVAWAAFAQATETLADAGRFDGFAGAMPSKRLNAFFAADRLRR